MYLKLTEVRFQQLNVTAWEVIADFIYYALYLDSTEGLFDV